MTDDELRAAFDPNYKFPPIVAPAESVDTIMARLSAQADLVMQTCPYCSLTMDVNQMVGMLPVAVSFTHEEGCPDANTDRV